MKVKVDLSELAKGIPLEDFLKIGQAEDVNEVIEIIREAKRPEGAGGAFARGLGRGLSGIRDVGIGLRALVDDSEETREKLAKRQIVRDIERPPAVDIDQALDSPENIVKFAAGALGEAVPDIAAILAGGGVGAVVGRALARKAISRGVADVVLSNVARRGAITGALGAGSALGTGETAGEQLVELGEVNVPVSLAAGVAKGALDTILPLALGRAFGILDKELAETFVGKITDELRKLPKKAAVPAGIAGGSITEAATEALQEAIDAAAMSFIDENKEFLSEETIKRMKDAAFQAGIVGAILGGFGGAVSSRPRTGPKVVEDVPSEEGREEVAGLLPKPEPKAEIPDPSDIEAFRTPFLAEMPSGDRFIIWGPMQVASFSARGAKISKIVGDVPLNKTREVKFPRLWMFDETVSRIKERSNVRPAEVGIIGLLDEGVEVETTPLAQSQIDEFIDLSKIIASPLARDTKGKFSVWKTDGNRVWRWNEGTSAPTIKFPGKLLSPKEMYLDPEKIQPGLLIGAILDAYKKGGTDEYISFGSKEAQEFVEERVRKSGGDYRSLVRDYLDDKERWKRIFKDVYVHPDSVLYRSENVKITRSGVDKITKLGPFTEILGKLEGIYTRDIDRVRLRYDRYTTLEGKEVSFDTIDNAEGLVVLHSGYEKEARKVERLYKELMKEFGVKKLVAIVEDGTRSLGEYINYKVPVIRLDVRNTKSLSKLMSTALHEFGHLLMYHNLDRLPDNIKSSLVAAYVRDLFRFKQDTTINVIARFRLDLTNIGVNAAAARMVYDEDYYLRFHEWAAENFENWFISDAKPLDPVSRFFAAVARLIRRMYLKASELLRKEGISVDVGYRDFVEYLRNQARPAPPPPPQVSSFRGIPYEETGADYRLDKAASIVPPNLKEYAKASAFFNSLVKWGYNIIQLANEEKNRDIVWLQDYVTRTRQWATEANKWKVRANTRLMKWYRLGKDQADAVARLLLAVDAMEYLQEGEAPRWPRQDELQRLFEKYGVNEEGKEVYEEIVSDFRDFLDSMEQAALEELKRTTDQTSATYLEEWARIRNEFAELRKRPYFPHARFGKWAVVVYEDGKVVHMEQYESKRAAEAARRELQREFKGAKVALDKIPEEAAVFRGMPLTILLRIKEMPGITDQQKEWIDRMIAETSPAGSFAKRMLRRKNIPGYSKDAFRAYAQYFWHGSNYMARVKWGRILEDIVERQAGRDIRRLAQAGQDVTKRRGIQDFLRDHFKEIMNPSPDWAQLRSFAFMWYLGFSPMSAVLNLTQIPMVAWPYLAARFGDSKAFRSLIDAAKGIRKMYEDPEKAKPDDFEMKMLKIAVEQEFIDESMATELAAVAEGAVLARMRLGNEVTRTMSWLADKAAWLFQQSEKFNRRIVFRAALKLAMEKPGAKYLKELERQHRAEFEELVREKGLSAKEARAFLAAKDAVIATQFEYARWARPRFMRGRKGTVLTFYMFTQNMLFFAARQAGRGRMLLMLLAMGGLMGLPGAEDLNEIAKYIGRKLYGKHFDPQLELRKFLTEVFEDPRVADNILFGLSREGFGMGLLQAATGIPLPVVDMSRSIGMGQIVPGLSDLAAGLANDKEIDEVLGRAGQRAAGASFGIFINAFRFLNDSYMPITDAKRWELIMPRQMKAVARAYRYLVEGRERTRGGYTVLEFNSDDPVQMAEIAAIALGATPTRISRTWDRIMAQQEVVNYWKIRRSILMQAYWTSARDREARKDVMKSIAAFNKEVPYASMKITRKTIRRSMKQRQRLERLRMAGVYPEKMYRPLAREVAEAFPSPKLEAIDYEILRQ